MNTFFGHRNATDAQTLRKLKDFVKRVCPNHIREYNNGSEKNPKPGTYWAWSALGMVWYDVDGHCQTFDEALEKLINVEPVTRYREQKKSDAELANQKLKAENEALKVEILELKAKPKGCSCDELWQLADKYPCECANYGGGSCLSCAIKDKLNETK